MKPQQASPGKKFKQAVFEKYYPEELPKPETEPESLPETPSAPKNPITEEVPPPFDFRAEMNQTRTTVGYTAGERRNR